MNKHTYIQGSNGRCAAEVGGESCGLPREASVHQDLPPARNENDRRPRERQDF